MELLALQDVNLTIHDRRFKHSVASPFIAGVIFLSLAVGSYLGYRLGKIPLSGVFAAGGFFLFLALMFLGTFRKAMAPTNWLMGVKKVVSLLSRQGIAVGEKRREVIDLTLRKGDTDKIEDKIVQLIERGNMIAAVKLVRRTYNYNLTEAKEFVEGLLE